ncbi:hypothetical protein AHiyo8_04020 [Arthrobacter sp. Hiyo8]|nr:hypothetical protein AHiyo8_04020 [Arthrobacter sp. Hiyo8]
MREVDRTMAGNRDSSINPLFFFLFGVAGSLALIGGLISGSLGFSFWLGLVTLLVVIIAFVVTRVRRSG